MLAFVVVNIFNKGFVKIQVKGENIILLKNNF